LAAGALFAQDGVIAGVVRDGDTKAPIAGAAIEVGGPQALRQALSDANGEFRFEHLVPGNYRLKYTLTGYFGSDTRGTAAAVIAAADSVERVSLEMTAYARLEGTVFDEEGRPFEGVLVYTGTNYQTTTGPDGHYTIEHLRPGSYLIVLRTPYPIRRKNAKRDPETGEVFGYANTEFYPGVAEAQAGTPVSISRGLDLRNFDMRLRRVRLVELTGRAVDRAGGQPLPGARIELIANNVIAPLQDETYRDRALGDDGSFRFDLIQPGAYTLLIYRSKETRGSLPYATPAEIGKTGLSDLKIAVPPFASLQGTVVAPPDTEWHGQLIFAIRSPLPGVNSRDFTVSGSHFAIEELPPGKWIFSIDSATSQQPGAAKLLIQSARFGPQDCLTEQLNVVESGNPALEIRLGTESGQIAGSVAEAGRVDWKNTMVAVSRVGAGLSMNFQTVQRVRDDGNFLLEGLAPGTYRIIVMDPGRPVFYSTVNEVKVEVRAGETTLVRLK
jgi:hypothetical protein